jgi:methylphosphotriester-DNA--protein-cysteine methyltransferase
MFATMLMSFEELAMSAVKAKRGRPTGSGINDRIWLREIGHLIRIKPATKPTAAIKALGITDPSTIRRLRDKHKRMTPHKGV